MLAHRRARQAFFAAVRLRKADPLRLLFAAWRAAGDDQQQQQQQQDDIADRPAAANRVAAAAAWSMAVARCRIALDRAAAMASSQAQGSYRRWLADKADEIVEAATGCDWRLETLVGPGAQSDLAESRPEGRPGPPRCGEPGGRHQG